MLETFSQIAGRDARLAMLLGHKWQAEIEKAVDNIKMGVVPATKRTRNDKWFRRQWYKSMMRGRRRNAKNGKGPVGLARRGLPRS